MTSRLVATLAIGAALVGAAQAQIVQMTRNQPMPPFILTTIGGKKLTNASLKGKVVLFDFWATWCGPCKAASPVMEKLQKAYASKGLVVIGADVFENQPGPQGAIKYSKSHGFDYTFTYENDGLAKNCDVSAIPAFVLMDRNGKFRLATRGVPPQGPDYLYGILSNAVKKLL